MKNTKKKAKKAARTKCAITERSNAMTVRELNREQLEELKQRYLTDKNAELGEGVSYGEIADADSTVSDEEIFKEYDGVKFSEDDFFCSCGTGGDKRKRDRRDTCVVTAYVVEVAKGEYLKINACEDDNGTWWSGTSNIWDAYWHTDIEQLRDIMLGEFTNFDEGYPKYHKVRFSYRILDTVE